MNLAPLLIRNARLIDPASGKTENGALAIQDGLIAAMGPGIDSAAVPDGATVIDAKGMVLAPGLIDLRAFVGEPGHEHRETLASASAAAAGGPAADRGRSRSFPAAASSPRRAARRPRGRPQAVLRSQTAPACRPA